MDPISRVIDLQNSITEIKKSAKLPHWVVSSTLDPVYLHEDWEIVKHSNPEHFSLPVSNLRIYRGRKYLYAARAVTDILEYGNYMLCRFEGDHIVFVLDLDKQIGEDHVGRGSQEVRGTILQS